MKFLKKDINTSLLVLITFFLIMFIGFTIYYESALSYVVQRKNINEEKLGEITAKMTLEQLNNSDKLKKIALLDKTLLEQKYNELVVQSENMKKEEAALQDEITLLKSQIEYQKSKVDGPTAQFRLIQEKNEQIKKLNEKISALCLVLKSYNITNGQCS